MDRFHDFDNLKQSLSVYGGSCIKFPAKIDNDEYIVKYPSAGNSNEAFSEYIVSHIILFLAYLLS